MSELNDHLRSLARQFDMRLGSTISHLDTADWPSDRLQVFIQMGILIPIAPATEIRCNGCGDGCSIEPEIQKLHDGTMCGIFFCNKESKMLKFPIKNFQQWEIVRSKIDEYGITTPPRDEYISHEEAASILGLNSKGTVSKYVDKYGIADNGKIGQHKKLLLSSVLLIKHKIEAEDLKNDVIDLRKDSNTITKPR
ncbi:MAG: hypothetical protein A2Y12_15050 [Planctomycetes bacterium GWF2_42_9]|nr:MAG: hypothetical protein A2Y12_15050 [Planctomycetes bacterium GWF2_42_9]